jgi:hypothetical protein
MQPHPFPFDPQTLLVDVGNFTDEKVQALDTLVQVRSVVVVKRK